MLFDTEEFEVEIEKKKEKEKFQENNQTDKQKVRVIWKTRSSGCYNYLELPS